MILYFKRKYLIRYYGMNGFKKIIESKRKNEETADNHFGSIILRNFVQTWHINVRLELKIREQKADEFYNKILVKTYFGKMKQFKKILLIEEAKANRFYKYRIKLKLFETWKLYNKTEKQKAIQNEQLIKEHNEYRLKSNYFKIWKVYPAEMKRTRIRQKRLDELRSKVREMIPDYESPVINSTETVQQQNTQSSLLTNNL